MISQGNLSCVPYEIRQFDEKYNFTIEEIEYLELKRKQEEIENANPNH